MTFRAYLVEDSSLLRIDLTDTLAELAGVAPVASTDSEHEARRWLAGNAWDLAVVDLFLREGSGMNVLEACRQRRPGQKIVVLSNHATRDVRWRCAQLGADAVFDKSNEIEAFLAYCVAQREQVEAGPGDTGDRLAPQAPPADAHQEPTAPAMPLPAAPA
ncbi:MAG TPA: response regulator [Ramlibacter sp.]|nr:response regulator [Ramlibacter sp.]